MSSAWALFGSDSDDDKESTVSMTANSGNNNVIATKSQVKVPSTAPTAVATAERPWHKYIPKFSLSPAEQKDLFANQRTLITSYHKDPHSHPDMKDRDHHVDGFRMPPLYQSPLISVDVNMPHRGGGRGIIANEDIHPGTLLMAEHTRYPFLSKAECVKRETRVEFEFLQELIFEMPVDYAKKLLEDLEPLHPHKLDEITPSHMHFLRTVYEEAIQAFLDNAEESRKEAIGLTMDVLLRVVCLIHFNSFPSGISLHIAMVNHSCAPNAVKIALPKPKHAGKAKDELSPWDPEYLASISEIRAAQFIPKGEEVTICYISPDVSDFSRPFRQGYLMRQFQFACTCELCEKEKDLFPHTAPAHAPAHAHAPAAAGVTEESGATAPTDAAPASAAAMSYIDRLVTYYYNVPTDALMFDAEGNFRTEDDNTLATVSETTGIECPANMSLAAFIIQEAVALLTRDADKSSETTTGAVSTVDGYGLTAYEQEQVHRLLVGAVKSILPHLHAQSVESLAALTAACAKLPWFSALPLAGDVDVVAAGVRVGAALREEYLLRMKGIEAGAAAETKEETKQRKYKATQLVKGISVLFHDNSARIVASLTPCLTALGLMSSMRQLDDFIVKFGVHPSIKYADHLLEVSQSLQGLLASPSIARKVLLSLPFTEWIGATARDGGLFEREAFKAYTRVCELYNLCPVDGVIKV